MKMSDKDLDKLFSSQLADMEIEPSVAVWNNIKREVSGEEVNSESKKSIIPMLQIAAGIIVFASVALLFRPHTEKVALRVSYTAAAITNGVRPSVITPQPDAMQDMRIQDAMPEIAVADHREINTHTPGKTMATIAEVDSTRMLVDLNDNISLPQRNAISTGAVPTPKLMVAIEPTDEQHIKPKTLALSNTPALKENPTVKKKKIRSLGDLFNVVIAKVDKRPNKIIQFENNEEEEGDFGVSGVNLGPIQIKKNN